MNLPSKDEFYLLLKNARVSKRLQRGICYSPDVVTDSDTRDFIAATTKSGNEGVLLYDQAIALFALERRRPNANGRVEAIICDICATWQRGTSSAIITFQKDARRSVSYLVCADLDCSLHVRDMTDASKLSRTQLREHITPEARAERLLQRLGNILA